MARILKPWILHHLPTIFAGPQGSKQMVPCRKNSHSATIRGLGPKLLCSFIARKWFALCISSQKSVIHMRSWRRGSLTVSLPSTSSCASFARSYHSAERVLSPKQLTPPFSYCKEKRQPKEFPKRDSNKAKAFPVTFCSFLWMLQSLVTWLNFLISDLPPNFCHRG